MLKRKINVFFEEKWQNINDGMKTGLLNDGIAINGRLKLWKGAVHKGEEDKANWEDDRSTEIIKLVKHKREFWNKAMKIAEDYNHPYRSTLWADKGIVALMNREGFKSETHDCLFYYLEERHKEMEIGFDFLHELRRTRNEIDYRGASVPKEAWNELKLKINLIANLINLWTFVSFARIANCARKVPLFLQFAITYVYWHKSRFYVGMPIPLFLEIIGLL